jgi:phenylacetate-CoA ligase
VAEYASRSQVSKLKEELGYDSVALDYAATEYPGFSANCSVGNHHHVWADFYLVETVDPKTHEVLGEGEKGELVVTSLQREAYPLIRYLSRDITCLEGFERCQCGLTHPKIGAEIDREDFMVKFRGTSVFPSMVESILEQVHAPPGRIQLIVDKRTPRQEATLKIETREHLPDAELESTKRTLSDHIRNRIGVTIDNIEFVPFGVFPDKVEKTIVIE